MTKTPINACFDEKNVTMKHSILISCLETYFAVICEKFAILLKVQIVA